MIQQAVLFNIITGIRGLSLAVVTNRHKHISFDYENQILSLAINLYRKCPQSWRTVRCCVLAQYRNRICRVSASVLTYIIM
jgi:hypothetical protein